MAEATAERERTETEQETEAVVRAYFAAVTAKDVEGMIDLWTPGGAGRFAGGREISVPDGYREQFGQIFRAIEDWDFEVEDLYAHQDRATVRWRVRGTFSGAPFEGLEPTGDRIELEGADLLVVRDGKVADLVAFINFADFARQVGVMPPMDSALERRMTAANNARTRLARRIASEPERVADGVWRIAGGFPLKMVNTFLIEDGDGVVVYDAGIRQMARAIAMAAGRIGPVRRVVLGNGHSDHRGGAGAIGAPVFCHPAERPNAESPDLPSYFDYSKLSLPPARFLVPRLQRSWDGGPVEVAGTLEEGDEVAGFRVLHLPGHAPGVIGLWRESDRLALSNDCFAMIDGQTGIPVAARVPHPAFNHDTGAARESIRKLAALGPATAWPGHFGPLTGDVRGTLERLAAG
jgi:glyoxylase-like metal-dependent hydrolase (beta-lactamase superfamily II)/predicted ester cyclase